MKRFFKKLWHKVTGKTHKYQEAVQRVTSDGPETETSHPTSYKTEAPFIEDIYKTEGIKMRTRGEYRKGFPEGLVVHWTSGWQLKRGFWPFAWPTRTPQAQRKKLEKMAREYALRSAKGGAKNGYNFLVMDVFGRIYNSRPLTKHGYHAGKSYWPSAGYNVSKRFAGVEILNPGKLKQKSGKFFTWYGLEIPASYVRFVEREGNRAAGHYCKYTEEQERALKGLCLWMKKNSPSGVFRIENVVGHDEVSPGRKSDPGGSLSMTMENFRRVLQTKTNSETL